MGGSFRVRKNLTRRASATIWYRRASWAGRCRHLDAVAGQHAPDCKAVARARLPLSSRALERAAEWRVVLSSPDVIAGSVLIRDRTDLESTVPAVL